MLAKRKRTYSSTADAFNAAMAANSRDVKPSPRKPGHIDRTTAEGHAEVFGAAIANNVNLDHVFAGHGTFKNNHGRQSLQGKNKPTQTTKARRHTLANKGASSSATLSKKPRAAQPLSEREASEEIVKGLLEPSDSGDDWYLDYDTLTWRRRGESGKPPSGSSAPISAPVPASMIRSDAGPSSAVLVDSHTKAGPSWAQPGLPDMPTKPIQKPTGRPRGRPRKHPLDEISTVIQAKRPRGRPRKNQLGESPEKLTSTGRPRGRPRKHLPVDVPNSAVVGGEGALSSVVSDVAREFGVPSSGFSSISSTAPRAEPSEHNHAPSSSKLHPDIAWIQVTDELPGKYGESRSAPIVETSVAAHPISRSPVPLPAGTISESEGSTSTLVPPSQSRWDPPHNEVRAIEQPDVKMVVDDDDGDVVEYLDLSTWGQTQQSALPVPVRPIQMPPPAPTPPVGPPVLPAPVVPQFNSSHPARQPSRPQMGQFTLPSRHSNVQQLVRPNIHDPYPRAPLQPPPQQVYEYPRVSLQPPPQQVYEYPRVLLQPPPQEVHEYQSLEALVASLVSYSSEIFTAPVVNGPHMVHSSLRPHTLGPQIAGTYSIIVDERTKLVEPFVRKIAAALRKSLRGRSRWNFRLVVWEFHLPSLLVNISTLHRFFF